jgi:hypothetical protein
VGCGDHQTAELREERDVNLALWLPGLFVLGIALWAFCYWFLNLCEKM